MGGGGGEKRQSKLKDDRDQACYIRPTAAFRDVTPPGFVYSVMTAHYGCT